MLEAGTNDLCLKNYMNNVKIYNDKTDFYLFPF